MGAARQTKYNQERPYSSLGYRTPEESLEGADASVGRWRVAKDMGQSSAPYAPPSALEPLPAHGDATRTLPEKPGRMRHPLCVMPACKITPVCYYPSAL